MRRNAKRFLLTAVTVFWGCALFDAVACTSAVVTGKVTKDGRPLLWKHRDTGQEQNRVEFFSTERYSFLALVDSPSVGGEAWIGVNEAGFSIMNTASYNLKEVGDPVKEMDREGVLMFRALSICKNLSDFERFLDTLSRPMGVEANFGVIDAEGGSAYYEVNNTTYNKVDVNDPRIAPNGYLIVTNFSYTGRFNEGMGYIRQQTASTLFAQAAPSYSISPQWIAQEVSRSFYHSLLGIDLKNVSGSSVQLSGNGIDGLSNGSGWFIDQDFIPRKSTSASVVVQGVKRGEDPQMCIFWTLLGYPPASVMVPLWVKTGALQPALWVRSAESQNAPLCEWAVALKHKSFSITRGSGSRYFYWRGIYNEEGSGYMQRLRPVEDEIFRLFAPLIAKWRLEGEIDVKALERVYTEVSERIAVAFSGI